MGKRETIYTVSYGEDCDGGTDFIVVGSYRTMRRALDECVGFLIQRLNMRDDVCYAFMNDEKHPGAAMYLEATDDGYSIPDPIALQQYLRDVIGGGCCYQIKNGGERFDFNVDENDLED